MTQQEAQEKVIELVTSNLYTKVEIASELDMSMPTFYGREKAVNWRKKEIDIIINL